MFDQPACTGRSASLFSWKVDFLDPITWEMNLLCGNIDTETVFRSVILEPDSQLILVSEEGKEYNLVNFFPMPSCEELPQGVKFVSYTYQEIFNMPDFGPFKSDLSDKAKH